MALTDDLKNFFEDTTTHNTLANLVKHLKEKSFAIIVLLLLLPSALPIPTGGLTNVFELIALFIALQMITRRPFLWLPQKLIHMELKWASDQRFVSAVTKYLQVFEKYLRPRFALVMRNPAFDVFAGIALFLGILGALTAPWFTGLDTLPSIGVVVMALALVSEDLVMFVLGLVCALIGLTLVVLVWMFGIGILGFLWQGLVNFVS